MTIVDLSAIAFLSEIERLRLAERHHQAVQAISFRVLSSLGQGVTALRNALVIAFAAAEALNLRSLLSQIETFTWADWPTLLRGQCPWLAMLLARFLLPYLLRLWRAARTMALDDARHEVSRLVHDRLRRNEIVLQ